MDRERSSNELTKAAGSGDLPDRKQSADIKGRCAEDTQREAAANQGEQNDRFRPVDLLLVDVKLVGEVGHQIITRAMRRRC